MKYCLLIFYIFYNCLNIKAQTIIQQDFIGCTFYDLQSNGSISNQVVVNPDGTIAVVWINSPDGLASAIPPFPHRGIGYQYFDGTNWFAPNCPSTSLDSARTGSVNIVNTKSGYEMIVADSELTGTPYNHIVVAWRITKGTGQWSWSSPWGYSNYDAWPKATSSGDTVYVIFNGSYNNTTIAGQQGPIYFSSSFNGGINFSPKSIINLIDSNYYTGFGPDNYSIDAKDSIVAIGFGSTYTDVGILKSTDYGQTWTKTIVQQHPIPFYVPDSITDVNNDGIADTLFTNGGDVKVLIDNNGMVHTWFSAMRYVCDTAVIKFYDTYGLEYWNENMGTNNYVEISTYIDYNGNGILDLPVDTFTICTHLNPFGYYDAGLTIMPSAGIDSAGKIYLTFSAINENADTTNFHAAHRHIYMMTLEPPYIVSSWSYPTDIIPLIADGGYGEFQEGAFACVGRLVNNGKVCILYELDEAPGSALAPPGSCSQMKNLGNSSELNISTANSLLAGTDTIKQNNFLVSQNYPNPSGGLTRININTNKTTDILFEIFNMVGQIVFSDSMKNFLPGNHTIQFDTSKLEPGIYTYSIKTESQKATRLMVIQ